MLFARFIKLLVGSRGAPSPILALPRAVATSTVHVGTYSGCKCLLQHPVAACRLSSICRTTVQPQLAGRPR